MKHERFPATLRRHFSFMPEGRNSAIVTCDNCGTRWRVKLPLGVAHLRLFDHAAGHETCSRCGRERRACGSCCDLSEEELDEQKRDREAAQRSLNAMTATFSSFLEGARRARRA